jgi:hypothetical protein
MSEHPSPPASHERHWYSKLCVGSSSSHSPFVVSTTRLTAVPSGAWMIGLAVFNGGVAISNDPTATVLERPTASVTTAFT